MLVRGTARVYVMAHYTMKILVVEDDRKIASFIQRGLKEQGFVVEVCADGNEGYTRAISQTYDVVILDIMLPGRDGLSILRAMREKKSTVPVILDRKSTRLNSSHLGIS